MNQDHSLREKVYSEPTSERLRPHVVEYISKHINQARQLSEYELLHGAGNSISSSICGALAWQGANGVEGEDWITEESEPILWKMFKLSGRLDANGDDLQAWQELFELSDKLNYS